MWHMVIWYTCSTGNLFFCLIMAQALTPQQEELLRHQIHEDVERTYQKVGLRNAHIHMHPHVPDHINVCFLYFKWPAGLLFHCRSNCLCKICLLLVFIPIILKRSQMSSWSCFLLCFDPETRVFIRLMVELLKNGTVKHGGLIFW